MTRLDGWPERLLDYIEFVRHRKHDLLDFNCAFYAAGAVLAITGIDAVEALGVKIEKRGDVATVLDKFGGARGLAQAFFGAPPLSAPLLARRGDIVIKDGQDGETLGVCVGDHALFLGDDGLQRRELRECFGVWRVG